MKLVINDKYINVRKKAAQLTTIASLGVLVVGLIFAFKKDTQSVMYSYVALIAGFLLSQIGMFLTNRFGRTPRIDQVITKAFANLRHDYTFFVYATPQPLVLTGPCGIWLLMPMSANGVVSYEKGKWKQKSGNFLLKTIGQEGIGNPTNEADISTAELRKYFKSKGFSDEELPEIKPVMVVVMKTTQLGNISESPLPIISLADLKRYIRRIDRENCASPLDTQQRERVNQVLLEHTKNKLTITEEVPAED